MATLDIRESEEQIDKIKFDDSSDYLLRGNTSVCIYKNRMDDTVVLVNIKDIDYLILALQKAKELWGK